MFLGLSLGWLLVVGSHYGSLLLGSIVDSFVGAFVRISGGMCYVCLSLVVAVLVVCSPNGPIVVRFVGCFERTSRGMCFAYISQGPFVPVGFLYLFVVFGSWVYLFFLLCFFAMFGFSLVVRWFRQDMVCVLL